LDSIPPSQANVVAFLAGLAGGPPLETHISCIFRSADTVWKLKKAVSLGFLDFTALADRRHFLDRELGLNAAAAPGLYRDVIPITRTAKGLALGGDSEPVDYVLRMARVPEPDFLDAMAAAGRLDPPLLTAIADAVVALHQALPAIPDRRPSEHHRLQKVIDGNRAAGLAAGLPAEAVAAWHATATALLARLAAHLDARAPAIRRCHGDLHLGNLLLWHGKPAAFDALEFNEDLATIDPGYDLAFLLMDLDLKLSRAAANIVLNRYLAQTGDLGLLAPLSLFLSLRAFIRAHVEAKRGRDAAPLLDAAQRYLMPARPVVVAVGGLQGTGKSTLARAIAPHLGAAPGALILRSDEIRKRRAGIRPDQRLPPDAYTPQSSAETQTAMLEALRTAIAAGHSVILDATFLDPAARHAAAHAAEAPFLGIWLHADIAILEARIMARRNDASDATIAVLHAAAAHLDPPPDWLRLDATSPLLQQNVQAALAVL